MWLCSTFFLSVRCFVFLFFYCSYLPPQNKKLKLCSLEKGTERFFTGGIKKKAGFEILPSKLKIFSIFFHLEQFLEFMKLISLDDFVYTTLRINSGSFFIHRSFSFQEVTFVKEDSKMEANMVSYL